MGGNALSDAAVRCRRPALDRALTRRVYSAAWRSGPFRSPAGKGRAGFPARHARPVHFADLDQQSHDFWLKAGVLGLGLDLLDVLAEGAFFLFEPFDTLNQIWKTSGFANGETRS